MFVFESLTHDKDCLVLFLGQYVPDSKLGLSGEIQRAYENSLTPEIVFLVYPEYLSHSIKSLVGNDAFSFDLCRYKNSPVVLVEFNEQGKFIYDKEKIIGNGIDVNFDLDKLALDIAKSGYDHLMGERSQDVLVKSPSGTIFSKPSGKTLEEFIYTSQLARSSCENQFLAMTLLRYAPKVSEIDCIYIDTASISAIAEALVYYITKFGGKNCKHVKYSSYSSYSGLDESKPSNIDGAWVVISASASMSMGKNIVAQWNIRPEQVVTILSYKKILSKDSVNNGDVVVFSVDSYSNRDKKSQSPIKVQVEGENFTAEVFPPNQILIRKLHKPDVVSDAIYKYRSGDVFSVNRDSRCLYVDYLKLRAKYFDEDKKLYGWIKQVVSWSVPKNLAAIIVRKSDADDLFCEDFKVILKEHGFVFDDSTVDIVRPDDDKKMAKIGDGAILILSPVISSGNYFVDVNRSLRLAGHKGMRVFATAYLTSPSREHCKRFKNSLIMATNDFRYAFHSYKTIYVDSKYNSTWVAEKKFITGMINHADASHKGVGFWIERKGLLEKSGIGLNGLLGVSYSDVSDKFELTKDFAFWPSGYENEDTLDLEAVYATVLSIFQNIRENNIAGDSLKSNIYQHSVISPENFVRFNDSILQSCLWRCANPSELDYRRSDQISSDFQRILSKIMVSSDLGRGVVSLDLLLAIALRWIKLSDKSLIKVIDDAKTSLSEPQAKLLVQEMEDILDIEEKKKRLLVQ